MMSANANDVLLCANVLGVGVCVSCCVQDIEKKRKEEYSVGILAVGRRELRGT